MAVTVSWDDTKMPRRRCYGPGLADRWRVDVDEATRLLFGGTLRKLRDEANMSQSRLAQRANVSQPTLSRFETGSQAPDEAIAARLDEILDTGGKLRRLVTEAREVEDMRRRGLLGMLGGVALSGVEGVLETVRRQLDSAMAGPITEDDAVELERAADRYSRQVGRLPAEQLLPEMLTDLVDARQHLEVASDGVRPRLLRVCSLLSGLAATSLVAAGYWADAERYWRTAQRFARHSGDREVACLVASKRSVLSLYMPAGHPATALGIADDALGWSAGRISAGSVSALAARAQGLALLGDRTGARATLAALETTCEHLDDRYTAGPTTWTWSETRLHHVRSFVHSHGGHIREAVAAQDVALRSYERPLSTGAVQVQMHRARSIIASGDPSQGVRHIVTMLERIEPSFRHGYVGTSAKFALQALPDKAKRLPDVRHARELISSGAAAS